MNSTSVVESFIENLFETFHGTLESAAYAIITDQILSSAKANVIEHVTALVSTPNNQSIAEMINYISDTVEFPPSVAIAVEDCTQAAFTNLTNIENLPNMDLLEYVPSVRNATERCVFEKDVISKIYELREETEDDGMGGWRAYAHLFWLSWGSTAVLFGPWCRVLFPHDRLLFAGIE